MDEKRKKKGFPLVLDSDLLAALRDEQDIIDSTYQHAPADKIPSNSFIQMLLSSARISIDVDPAEVFDVRFAMDRKKGKTPRVDLNKGNLALAQVILEAMEIKENAGLVRNSFTGRACYKLTDEEAARQATSDENTAQLAALILAAREPAFIDWARNIEEQHRLKASTAASEKGEPSSAKPRRAEG